MINTNFFNYAEKEKSLAAEIDAAEAAEVAREKGEPAPAAPAQGEAMSQFRPSHDVTGHLANDGETILAPLAGKTPEEIFFAHNVVDVALVASGDIPTGELCQCRDCQTYIAELRK